MSEQNTLAAEFDLSPGLIITVIRSVLKSWLLIVAAALIAAMGAFVYTDASYTPEYRTTTTFVATSGGTSTTTYSHLNAASNAASVFSEVINSSLLQQRVREATGISSFHGKITASAISDTNLLTMTVTGNDPRDVFLMSRAIIENHQIISSEVINNTILEVLQYPTVPSAPTGRPDVRRNMLYAAFAAALAAAGLLAVRSYTEDKVRSREEADRKLTCHVLGELYHEKKNRTLRDLLSRRKKSILITDPLTSFIYTEAVHKLSSRVDKRRHRGEHVVMVTSYLENEGKSTVAVNLALSMAKKGKRVLLIDCDMRKPACRLILGITEKQLPGTADVLAGKIEFDEAVRDLENTGLSLMTTRRSLRTATDLVNSSAMEELLQDAAEKFDIVIVDTPPMSVAPDAECIAAFAGAALLVVRQNEAFADDLNDAAAVLERAGAHLLGCILNNVYGSGGYSPAFRYGGYGKYGRYGKYGKYGYGKYGYGKYDRRKSASEENT